MERTAYQQLLRWKQSAHRKPLVVRGARQIGKTWLLQEFGRREYRYVAYLRCDNDPLAASVFEDYDVRRMLLVIESLTHVPIVEGETLIILDEVQEVPRGLHALKYLCEEASGHHVAVAGSLLGLLLHPGESFPVGKVDFLTMGPMTFPEFLSAVGESELCRHVEDRAWDVLTILHPRLVGLLRQYYYVGGMPAAVLAFAEGQGLQAVRTVQQSILEAYRLDISKHAPPREVLRIQQVLASIPAHLARENKKFVYGAVRKGARAADFELAIQWLVDAGVVHKVTRVKSGLAPLQVYEDMEAFKLYLLDCGLLGAMCETDARDVLTGDSILREYKGAFTESYVLQQLLTAPSLPRLFYYSTEGSAVEVDYVCRMRGRVLPIEVKAEENLRSKSLRRFVEEYGVAHAVRVSMSPYKEQDWMTNVPLYGVLPYFASLTTDTAEQETKLHTQ